MKDKTLDIGHCCARRLAIHLYSRNFQAGRYRCGFDEVTRGVGIATTVLRVASSLFRMVFFRGSWYCTESCYQFHSQAMVLDDVLYDDD
ncbi:hypothetical protein CY34DRAFT_800372 [Suillus luteus UH-Slu-Lm8-n1]|uniref:Uncharacterized protein n=1 Tax=Suillus luteus UH-Slu-Lm8-n1 TaxID=930992 RepID=A0A0D0BKP8_9AGAM|nr:hypothetical protein CY34DRAFT_800372 [Suillus luteus UH-Slu-Lm8-n1]